MTKSSETIAELVAWCQSVAPLGSRLVLDSRQVQPGDIFVAIPGALTDGRKFISVAQARGAAGVLYEAEGATDIHAFPAIAHLGVSHLAARLGEIADAYYGHPTQELLGIAVTGTNGKTTTTHWIAQMLNALDTPCAVMGTVGCQLQGRHFEAPSLTTPDALSLHQLFRDLKAAGAKAYAMEASSVGLDQRRLGGMHAQIGVFTNLTRDHLDYHQSMEAYFEAKTKLWSLSGMKTALINADDPYAEGMANAARLANLTIWSTSLKGQKPQWADVSVLATVNLMGTRGMELQVRFGERSGVARSQAIGFFNAENALMAIASALAAGFDFEAVLAEVSRLTPPPGRMHVMHAPYSPTVVVDYCHTPDAMEKVMSSLREVLSPEGKLWVVFGCGGNRDAGKRSLMGEVAQRLADKVVITSDNPRFEDPQAIIAAIAQGAPNAMIEPNRYEATMLAMTSAKPEDIVLLAGKGHEDYQEVEGQRHHYSDIETAREAFNTIYTRAHP